MRPRQLPAFHQTGCPAFTLIELLVILGVIGIMAMLLGTATLRVRARVGTTQCQYNLKSVNEALTLAQQTANGNY